MRAVTLQDVREARVMTPARITSIINKTRITILVRPNGPNPIGDDPGLAVVKASTSTSKAIINYAINEANHETPAVAVRNRLTSSPRRRSEVVPEVCPVTEKRSTAAASPRVTAEAVVVVVEVEATITRPAETVGPARITREHFDDQGANEV